MEAKTSSMKPNCASPSPEVLELLIWVGAEVVIIVLCRITML
jgi:hypothetical protein